MAMVFAPTLDNLLRTARGFVRIVNIVPHERIRPTLSACRVAGHFSRTSGSVLQSQLTVQAVN